MSEKLGPVRYSSPSMMYLHGNLEVRTDIGEGTAEMIDGEIKRLVIEAQEKAESILREHEKILHDVASVLQEKEVINSDEIKAIAERENSPAESE